MGHSTESIWNACSKNLRLYIARRISDQNYIDDLLQEVFLKVHSKIDTLKDDTKICSWVYQITQNTIIDYYRKHKPTLIDIDKVHLTDETDEETSILKNSSSADNNLFINEIGEVIVHPDSTEMSAAENVASGLKAMVESLPEKYSQAILSVEFEGLSQIDLADKLGISVSGAKSRVQRGRQMLKDMLMNCCHFEFDKYGTIIDSHPKKCCCCSKN